MPPDWPLDPTRQAPQNEVKLRLLRKPGENSWTLQVLGGSRIKTIQGQQKNWEKICGNFFSSFFTWHVRSFWELSPLKELSKDVYMNWQRHHDSLPTIMERSPKRKVGRYSSSRYDGIYHERGAEFPWPFVGLPNSSNSAILLFSHANLIFRGIFGKSIVGTLQEFLGFPQSCIETASTWSWVRNPFEIPSFSKK